MIIHVIAPHAVLLFALALGITRFYGKRIPVFCYFLWIAVLLKLVTPVGFFDFRIANLEQSISMEDTAEPQPVLSWPAAPALAAQTDPAPSTIPPTDDQTATIEQVFNVWDDINVSYVLLFLWSCVSVYVFYKEMVFINDVRRLIKISQTVSEGKAYSLFRQCAKEIGITSLPKLISTEYYDVPFVIGFWKTRMTVVVPSSLLQECSDYDLSIIFSHELSHIKRRDYLINLLRFVVYVLFHYHPIRMIADKYLFHYQEITADLFALRRMNIPQTKYINVLINVLHNINENKKRDVLQSPLLTSNLSMVKRLDHVYDYTPFNRVLHAVSCALISLVAFSAFGASIQVYSHFYYDGIVTLQETPSLRAFPEPAMTGVKVAHQSESFPKYRRDLLWVMEPMYGLYAYSLGDSARKVKEYTFTRTGNDNGTERVYDYDFSADTIYMAVGSPDKKAIHGGRIDVLADGPNGNLAKVSELAENSPRLVKTVGSYLWVGGFSQTEGHFYLAIYDIQNPAAPQFLDRVETNGIPIAAETDSSQSTLYISYENGIGVYRNPSVIYQHEFVETSSTPVFFKVLPDQSLVVYEIRLLLLGQYNCHLELLQPQDGRYRIASICKLVHPLRQPSFDSLLVNGNSIILTSAQDGIAFFQRNQNRLAFVSYKSGRYGGGVLAPDLVLSKPSLAFADTKSLRTVSNVTTIDNTHE